MALNKKGGGGGGGVSGNGDQDPEAREKKLLLLWVGACYRLPDQVSGGVLTTWTSAERTTQNYTGNPSSCTALVTIS